MNGEDDKNTAPVDIADIANEAFDAAGIDDNSELEFSYEGLNPEPEAKDELENDSHVKKPVDQEKTKPTQAETDTKLYAGKFKTVEELEKAFNEKTQSNTPPPRQSEPEPEPEQVTDDVPDLDDRELTLLIEQSEQDGKNYHEEYLRDKMSKRPLQKHEIEAIKSLDLENGTNLFQEYVSLNTERNVMTKLSPLLAPIQEEQDRKAYDAYVEQENRINKSNETEFGRETLDELEGKLKNADYINSILGKSELSGVITSLWDSNQKALSHKMLLREAQRLEASKVNDTNEKKRKASVPADVGSNFQSSKKTANKAGSIEEAFEMALQEN